MNFKDCLAALGKFHTDVLGCDCAGVIARTGEAVTAFKPGDRVYSGASNTFRTFVRAHHRLVMKMPEDMTFAEGASFPTAFLTAYHSLHKAARLEKHESILIHAAAGGTGQAAVQMALDIGAEIFALVGSLGKKKLLMEFYGIPEDHIFYSRDTSFADGIRRMTHGRGVDVVFSSLSGDGLLASWELVAPFGRFVEIGRNYISSRSSLPMYPFRRNVTFIGFALTGILERHIVGGNLLEEFTQMLEKGAVKPPHPLQVYPLAEIQQAFRTLSSGKSSGKMVLEVTKDAMVPVVQGPRSYWSLRPDASYVVVGGFGGIGRNICRWLASRGAKYLLLLSRSGPVGNEKALALIDELQSKGVVVESPTCDVADAQALNETISRCSKTLPPIKGCFQASMVLRVKTALSNCLNLFSNMTPGFNLRQHVPRRLGRKHPPQSPRNLEPPHPPTPPHGFLHHPLLPRRRHRKRRPEQLRSGKHLPRRSRPPSLLARRKSSIPLFRHFSERRRRQGK